jgi:argininosuccinate lyase
LQGTPFRDAYKKVGMDIEAGNFNYHPTTAHTHEGSIGNLCNDSIKSMMDTVIQKYNFGSVATAMQKLLG